MIRPKARITILKKELASSETLIKLHEMKILVLALAFFGSSYAGLLNLDSLNPIAEKVNSLKTTWKADSRIAPHVTESSFKSLLGVREIGKKLPLKEQSNELIFLHIPKEFDARKHWPNCPTISHIRDQGNCGSCWAVAGAGAMSDRVCIKSNGSFTDPLSEEELLSCCSDCGLGCNGGSPERAWEFFVTNGLVTGGDYESRIGCQPYSIRACEHHTEGDLPQCSSLSMSETPECQQECTNPIYTNDFVVDHHKGRNAYSLPPFVSEIQREIMAYGPVEAAFKVFADFPTYKSGVYQHVTGNLLGGHAVRIIGWGSEDGTDYWLAANSWNNHWGDNGTFKIKRGVNECEIEENIVAGIPL